MLEQLKTEVQRANLDLVKYNLVTLTWGNVSGISRADNLVVIKPSGVEYETLTVEDMVVVDMQGNIVEGNKRPSSDALTHIELYKAFDSIYGISHTHSEFATIWAQACMEIPCFGTTHADSFNGAVPITRFLTEEEVNANYELHTGKVIRETFSGKDHKALPGVLVAGHAPFTWGASPKEAVKNSLIMEVIAKMAYCNLQMNPKLTELPQYILNKHYSRKHGDSAYYGQSQDK